MKIQSSPVRAFLLVSTLLSVSCLVQPESDTPVTPVSSAVPESSSSQVQPSSSSIPIPPIDFCSHDSECSQGEYCELGEDPNTVSTQCYEDGRCTSVSTLIGSLGSCLPVPEVCPDIYAPVCIDGRTYSNSCDARAAGARGSYQPGECNPQDTIVTSHPVDTTSGLLLVRSGGGQLRAFINIITGDEAIPNPSVHMGVFIESMNYQPLNQTEWLILGSLDREQEITSLLQVDYAPQDEPAILPADLANAPEIIVVGTWVSVWVLVPGQAPFEITAEKFPELAEAITRLEYLVRSVIPTPY